MKKKRNLSGNAGMGDNDLADVNEQELAKSADVDKECISANGTEELTESVDASHEAEGEAPNPAVSDEVSVPPVQREEKSSLPTKEEQGTTFSQDGGEENDGEEATADSAPKVKEGRGYGYILLIAVCFLIAASLVVFSVWSVSGEPTSDTQATSDSDVSDNGTESSDLLDAKHMSADELYGARVRTSVGISGHTDEESVYFSGVGVFSDGYIATVYSPVWESGTVEVTLWDGSIYPAQVVGSAPEAKLTLLKIPSGTALEYALPEDCDTAVGGRLYAIGSAAEGALGASLYPCRVSHTERVYEFTDGEGRVRMAKVTQISGFDDGSMVGCPLFDEYGNALAMTFAAVDGENTGFAVSLSDAAEILRYIRDGERPAAQALARVAYTPALLGIEGEQACVDGIWGVEIRDFTDYNCDAALKLRRGDLIFRIDGVMVADTSTLRETLLDYASLQNAEIFVYRNGQKLSFPVTLK